MFIYKKFICFSITISSWIYLADLLSIVCCWCCCLYSKRCRWWPNLLWDFYQETLHFECFCDFECFCKHASFLLQSVILKWKEYSRKRVLKKKWALMLFLSYKKYSWTQWYSRKSDTLSIFSCSSIYKNDIVRGKFWVYVQSLHFMFSPVTKNLIHSPFCGYDLVSTC